MLAAGMQEIPHFGGPRRPRGQGMVRKRSGSDQLRKGSQRLAVKASRRPLVAGLAGGSGPLALGSPFADVAGEDGGGDELVPAIAETAFLGDDLVERRERLVWNAHRVRPLAHAIQFGGRERTI